MKRLFSVFIFSFLAHLVSAQVRITDLAAEPLKGHVKEIIEYTFRGGKNTATVDTSRQPEKRIRRFDNNGNELEQVWYNKDDSINFRLTYTYPDNATVITSQVDANGKLYVKYTYKYDSEGEEIELDPDFGSTIQSAVSKFVYSYDDKGNRIEEDTYGTNNNIIGKNILVYNSQDELLHEEMKGTYINGMTNFTYDSFGNKITMQGLNADGTIRNAVSYSYSNIDNNGNWLMFVSESSGSDSNGGYVYKDVVKRVITYY